MGTTEQSLPREEDEDNLIETSAEEQRPRIPSFRNRIRPRLRQRPRLPFRPKVKDVADQDDGDLDEMVKALKMESMLKKEFDKFLEGKLPSKRPRFRPTGTGLRDRSKIRNSLLRSRFRTTTPVEEPETTTLEEISNEITIQEITTTTETTTTATTTTTSTTTTTTKITTRANPTTTEQKVIPE